MPKPVSKHLSVISAAVVVFFALLGHPAAALDIPFTNGTVNIDGLLGDTAWSNATSYTYPGAGNNGPVTVKLMWDKANFYLGYSAVDQYLWNDSTDVEVWNDDSVDFNIDIHNDGGASWRADDVELDIDIGGDLRTLGGTQWWDPDDVIERQVALFGTVNDNRDIDSGYSIELKVPWTELITPYSGRTLGITFGNSDDDDGGPRDPGAYQGTPGTHPFVPDTYLDMTLTGGSTTAVPMYSNSVLRVKNYNLGDPAVAFHNGRYYTVHSPWEHQHNQIIMYSSPNLVDWDYEGVVYETPGTPDSWNEGYIFAPDLTIENGEFYIGYSARPNTNDERDHRVGIVHSNSITGTYTDLTTGPLFDTGEMAIDQRIEKVGDDYYVYWSQYQDNRGILGAKLNSSLTGLASAPQKMINQGNDETLVEAPWTYERDGTIYMFYSANPVSSEDYLVGYATATSPLGPFTKRGHILVKNSGVKGPGHNSVVDSPDGKETFIVYHTWAEETWQNDRKIAIDRLYFREDGSIYTFGPTTDEHPLPSGADGSFGVLPIGNPGFETGTLANWSVSSTSGSTSHIFVESNFDPAQNQEGQQHAAIWNAGTSEHGEISQLLTDLEEGATYRATAWTRNDGRTVTFGVTPASGTTVSLLANHIEFAKEELDFVVPFGSTQALLWFDSEAGSDFSWVWIDAIEVFKILDATIPGDFDQDGDVDGDDLTRWQGDFGVNGHSDADGDGDTDGADFLAWQRHFAITTSQVAAVPEPSAIAFVVIGWLLSLLSLRQFRQL